MTQIIPNVEFDYVNKQIKASVQSTGTRDFTSVTVSIRDPAGYICNTVSVSASSNYQYLSYGSSIGNMGITQGNYGVDDTLKPRYQSGLYFTDLYTNWQFSRDVTTSLPIDPKDYLSGYETGTLPFAINIAQMDDVYNGVPVLVTRGDAVGHYHIAVVSGKSFVQFRNTDLNSLNHTGHNFNDCIGEIISGARLGERFHVDKFIPSRTGLVVDRDLTAYSGDYFKLMPYRTIIGYSGWEDYMGGTERLSGIQARFDLNTTRPSVVGSTATSFADSGSYSFDPGTLLGATAGVVSLACRKIIVAKENYMKTPAVGDVLYYNPNFNASLISGAVILEVGQASAPFDNYWSVVYYPECQPIGVGTATIYRANTYQLLTYPKFDTNYLVTAQGNGVLYGSNIVKSPSANIEVSANDHDSTYNTIGEKAHFHIGPVTLSNGQVLKNDYLLRLSGSLYQGDVTLTTPVSTWVSHGTLDTTIGTANTGMFMKHGVLTATHSQALNASETLFLDINATYGAAKANKVITIPVQPSA